MEKRITGLRQKIDDNNFGSFIPIGTDASYVTMTYNSAVHSVEELILQLLTSGGGGSGGGNPGPGEIYWNEDVD